uniref:tRNA-specific adenosine deaminase 1 n=1 Tax=Tetranychus urticae TaxID=32264 RepID=T1K6F6_TETUR
MLYANHGIHRKPGRGEPCNEASCIDKILKWSYLGIQGKRLISLTRRPIRLKSIIIGNCK